MRRRNILYLSMHYKPEPCDTRTSVLAQEMAKRGHASTVLTSFPNYPYGRVYEGYRQKIWQRQTVDDVSVVRVPMFPDHSLSIKRRALSYASFGAAASLLGPALTKRPDLVWIHHPPLTTGLAGWWMSWLKRVPFVYEVHDLWPETLMSSGVVEENRVTRAIRSTCDFLHKRAAAVVVTSPGMKAHLAHQGLVSDKIHVIPQWADEEALAPIGRDREFGAQHGMSGKFNLVFTGNVGAAQAGDTILQAARLLQNLGDVQFVVVGTGVELGALRTKSVAMGLTNVRFLGQFRKEDIPSFFAWSDALLVTLKSDPLFAITIPSKTQAYLYAGRPILCGVAGDTARVIENAGAGLTFPPEDGSALAHAICELRAMPEQDRLRLGANGRAAYENSFSTQRLVTVYEELFDAVLDKKAARIEEPHVELSRSA